MFSFPTRVPYNIQSGASKLLIGFWTTNILQIRPSEFSTSPKSGQNFSYREGPVFRGFTVHFYEDKFVGKQP